MNKRYTKPEPAKKIPPPPGPEDGYDAIIEYFQKYNWDDLEKAGYLEEPSAEELEDLIASATYQQLREQGLQLKLTRKEYDRLADIAAKQGARPDAIVQRWIKERLRPEIKSKRKPRLP